MNTIVFINYLVVVLVKCAYIITMFIRANHIILYQLFSNYIPFIIILVIYFGIIFYSKKKIIIKPNAMSIICLVVYIICLIGFIPTIRTLGISKFEVAIKCIVETMYYIPTILYFRLYALNKLKKMEVKNER